MKYSLEGLKTLCYQLVDAQEKEAVIRNQIEHVEQFNVGEIHLSTKIDYEIAAAKLSVLEREFMDYVTPRVFLEHCTIGEDAFWKAAELCRKVKPHYEGKPDAIEAIDLLENTMRGFGLRLKDGEKIEGIHYRKSL